MPQPIQTTTENHCVAFLGNRNIAHGALRDVALAAKHAFDSNPTEPLLILDCQTSRFGDLDLIGSVAAVAERYPAPLSPEASSRRSDRPRLGVVGKEVTLLPRHWEWLGAQPGGASVALRKLVEQARKVNVETDQARRARDSTHRFMTTMAGDLAGFEEATRALFSHDQRRFKLEIALWPTDIRLHLEQISTAGFDSINSDQIL